MILPFKINFKHVAFILTAAATVIGPATASAASQSYNVLDNKAQLGMLVSLTANSNVVTPATDKNTNLLLGVIDTGANNFSQEAGQVSVEADGKVSALVSTLNGDIHVGDRIAPSSLAGIGTKAIVSGWVVGIAQASLDAKTAGTVASTISDAVGRKHQVEVTRIPLVVRVAYYTVPSAASTKPNALQAAADSLAGKHASVVGIVLSFFLIIIGIFFAGQVITSTVRSAFAAIARQPLSKTAVTRLALRSFAVAVLIVTAVLGGAYLVLRVF